MLKKTEKALLTSEIQPKEQKKVIFNIQLLHQALFLFQVAEQTKYRRETFTILRSFHSDSN